MLSHTCDKTVEGSPRDTQRERSLCPRHMQRPACRSRSAAVLRRVSRRHVRELRVSGVHVTCVP